MAFVLLICSLLERRLAVSMKSKLFILSFLALTTIAAYSSPTTVAQWTFETSVPTTAGPLSPEVGSGTAIGFHAGASVYSNPVGNGSAESWSSTIWTVGDYYQFQVSTFGYQDIVLSWDQTSSGTGPRDFKLQYSVNGTTFTDFATYAVLENISANGGTWSSSIARSNYSYSYDLTSILALDNVSAAYFRLIDISTTSANGGTVASGGTDRVDNFTITAKNAYVPAPSVPETLPVSFGVVTLIGILSLSRCVRKSASA